MRKLFSVILSALTIYPLNSFAEDKKNDKQNNLESYNQSRNEINKIGMFTLGGWSLANIITGLSFYNSAKNEGKYFHEMNIAWNLINLGIAGLGYYGAVKQDNNIKLTETLNEQKKIENILLLNTGLDIAYSSVGLYLKEKSKSSLEHKERLEGYGNSLIMQGAFLFLFDLTMFYIHNQHNKELENITKNIDFKNDSISYNINF